jgi:hypothetical protein
MMRDHATLMGTTTDGQRCVLWQRRETRGASVSQASVRIQRQQRRQNVTCSK